MTVSLQRQRRRWLVVFRDEPTGMRIVAVRHAPTDPDSYAELSSELAMACLSAYAVAATTAGEARRTARELRDVARIQGIFAQARIRDRYRRRPALRACTASDTRAALTHARQFLALTMPATERAERILLTALRSAWDHRPVHQRYLTFDQYVYGLNPRALAALYQHAAHVAAGSPAEAVASLIHALDLAFTQAS